MRFSEIFICPTRKWWLAWPQLALSPSEAGPPILTTQLVQGKANIFAHEWSRDRAILSRDYLSRPTKLAHYCA